jgi:phage-related protein
LVKSRDDAKPDVTALQAKLKELGSEVETARADVDTAEGAAKLDKLTAQLLDLNKRTANPKISMQGAVRAEAQLHAIEAAFGKLTPAADEAATGVDDAMKHVDTEVRQVATDSGVSGNNAGKSFFSRFASWLKPSKFQLITTGIASGLAALPALTGAIGAAAGIALGAKLLIGSKQAQGPLYAQFTSMMHGLQSVMKQAVTPLIGPLRSAFGQFGSFVHQIGGQVKAVFAALAPMVQPLVYGLEGLVGGILPGFIALMKAAQPAVRALASLLAGLGRDLGGMFSAFAPAIQASAGVLRMLASVVNGLFPVIGKLAASLAQALGPVLKGFGQALKALMPALLTVGKVLGELAGAVLQSLSGALTAVAALVKGIAPSFGILARAMGQVFDAMENAGVFGILEDSLEKLAKPLARLINALVRSLVPVLPQVITLVTQFAAVLASGVAQVLADVANAVARLVTKFPVLVPAVLAVVGAIKAWSIAQAVLNAVMTANPIGLIVVGIAALIVAIVEVVKHWHTIASVAKSVFAKLRSVIADVINWVKAHWPLLLSILGGPIGAAAALIITHWHQIANVTAAVWNAIVNFFTVTLGRWVSDIGGFIGRAVAWFKSLPGRILSAVGSLGSLLFDAGKNVIQGLIDGITSMIGSVGHAIGSVVGEIRNFLPFSPAKKGPLSGSGAPDRAGRAIARMLASGMTAGMGDVSAAAGAMAGGARFGGARFGGRSGAGGGQIVIEFHANGSALSGEFFTQLANGIRVRGGSPGIVQRKVVFR